MNIWNSGEIDFIDVIVTFDINLIKKILTILKWGKNARKFEIDRIHYCK